MADPSPPRGAERRTALAFAAALVLLWIAPLGLRALVPPDEGRYADLALHMLASGDWITPRLNGLLYFEKPPLVMWAGALAMRALGVNEFAARLPAALAGLGCVAAAAWAARAWWGNAGALRAAAYAASMTWLVLNAHILTLDAALSFGTTLAVAGVLRAFAPGVGPRLRRRALLVAWGGLALATLAKGPVGIVIPAGALLVYTGVEATHGRGRQTLALWRDLEWTRGLALLAAIVLPWFLAVSQRNPGFAWFFFVHEHLLRYTTTVHERTGAWWYFAPFVLAGALPWTPRLVRLAWADARAPAGAASAAALRPLPLLWSLAGFVLVFFSASASKLPSYVLPMFPALALVAAAPRPGDAPRRAPEFAPLALWLALPPALWLAQAFGDAQWKVSYLPAAALAGTLVCVAAWLAARRSARQGRDGRALAWVALGHVAACLIALQGHDPIGRAKGAVALAPRIEAAVAPAAPVFAVGVYDHTLPFYLRRPVTLVAFEDEFAFGQAAEPARWIASLEDFETRWRAQPDAVALMAPAIFDAFQARALPMRVIARDAQRVVVARR